MSECSCSPLLLIIDFVGVTKTVERVQVGYVPHKNNGDTSKLNSHRFDVTSCYFLNHQAPLFPSHIDNILEPALDPTPVVQSWSTISLAGLHRTGTLLLRFDEPQLSFSSLPQQQTRPQCTFPALPNRPQTKVTTSVPKAGPRPRECPLST